MITLQIKENLGMLSSAGRIGLWALLTITLSSISNCQCKDNCEDNKMAFPNQRSRGWELIPYARNGQWIEDTEGIDIASQVKWDHGFSRRLLNTGLGNNTDYTIIGTNPYRTYTLEPGIEKTIIEVPLKYIANGSAGYMRVHLYAKKSNANNAYMVVKIGTVTKYVDFTTSGAYELLTLNVPMTFNGNPGYANDDRIKLSLYEDYLETTNVDIEVAFYSAFEHRQQSYLDELPYISGMANRSLKYTDLNVANSKLGLDDMPCSAGLRSILIQNQIAIHQNRAARCNVLNQRMLISIQAPGAGYDARNAGWGEWIVRKPEGSTELVFYAAIGVYDTPGEIADVRVSLYGINDLAYVGQTVNFTVGKMLYGQTSGAQARILHQTDAGVTGTLRLGFVEGAFQNGEPIVDSAGGAATASGTLATPTLIANVDNAIPYNAGGTVMTYSSFSFPGLPAEDCEYWVRLDSKINTGTPGYVEIPWIAGYDVVESDVAYSDPTPEKFEQDDDIRALNYRQIKTTQTHIWKRHRQLVLSDWRWYYGSSQFGAELEAPKYSGLKYIDYWTNSATLGYEDGRFGNGPVYLSPETRAILARVWVYRADTTVRYKANMLTSTSGFPPWYEEVGIGASSGAVVVMDGSIATGSSGYVYFKSIRGAIDVNTPENVVFPSTTCTFSSFDRYKGNPKISLSLFYNPDSTPPGDPVAETIVDCSGLPEGRTSLVQLRVIIPSNLSVNSMAIPTGGTFPLLWQLRSFSSEPGDHLELVQRQVFEEPLFSTTILSTEEDY